MRALALSATEQLAAEGITVYAVPRAAIARRLLTARTSQARRRVLGDAFAAILDDCDLQLSRCAIAELGPYIRTTARAIAAARAGHVEAAQALGANVVDSLLVYRYGWRKSRELTNHARISSVDLRNQLTVDEYLVLAPIHASYVAYWPGRGLPVPHQFARHVTTHHAVPRQFSRRNAAQVLMQATSLLALLARELGTPGAV